MCGIAGGSWINPPARLKKAILESLGRMAHRGPDDQGFEIHERPASTTALAQTRLSIIDLTSGGRQPMFTADGRLAMVFNGEIYNYLELRGELRALGHDFRTCSDSEVLLLAWRQWGVACLRRLTGMFAIAVHDREARTLTLVRDAFGIKPLFHAHEAGRLTFASELPALMSLAETRPEPNPQRAYDFLVHGEYDSNEATFIQGVQHVLPGHYRVYDTDAGALGDQIQWWRAPIRQTSTLSFGDAADAVRQAFLDSVKLHLRSDVPLGAALSGGIDSSAVVCAMRHVAPDAPIHTFSYIAAGSPLSEESWVDMVNAHTGAIGHKVVASAEDLAADIDDMILCQGEPFGSTSIYAQYRVYQRAAEKGITVTLDGQGADELLAGYAGYPGQRLRSLLEGPGGLFEAHRFAKAWSRWPARSYRQAWMYYGRENLPDQAYAAARTVMGRPPVPDWIDEDALAEAGVDLRAPRMAARAEGHGRRVVERLGHSLQVHGLPHLLRHGDRNSMKYSLESRVPFLTVDLVELLLGLPEEFLISPTGETKSVFRAAMRGIVPDAILDRRDKIGFATPEREWLATLAPRARHWLEGAENVPFLRKEPLLKAFDDMMAGRTTFSWQAWRWINYVRWYKQLGRM
ncbi:asparagine synthase (glutamine-hydrolyzing) [Brevundimonas halotolerans]|uniref:asparagine synthase (glutamine-hydrolyzing) n=1 Tax=Brevundimonas halotolerans TaxID=69670 RepID=A0A7W9A4T0_9CAUL|nr:asparagine synthase (glutamine-hydrolyzing) [Brevundimonas halotolerans]MBB5661411.1 asparagine synthase (glutamine-hydrolyzing) [Brevundimonas halotolerans]